MNEPGRVTYVNYIGHDGTHSTFCMSRPHHVDFGGYADPQFHFMIPGKGWRVEEHLNFLGADGSLWVTKAHANGMGIWFSSGHPGQSDHDGEMPILKDPTGRMWRVLEPRADGADDKCSFLLKEYFG